MGEFMRDCREERALTFSVEYLPHVEATTLLPTVQILLAVSKVQIQSNAYHPSLYPMTPLLCPTPTQ
jgi:uncharacterized membrane-anchored protein